MAKVMTEHKYRGVKALTVFDDYFIGAVGYRLYKYYFDGKRSKEYVGRIADCKYVPFSRFSLTRRFMRAEITALYHLADGSSLAIARKGVFRCENGAKKFYKCFSVERGSRPMNLCITPSGEIFFGEYFANMGKSAVNIYTSKDGGKSWSVAYTFTKGNINHIHGLYWDKYTESIWIVTGDRENECIIGYTNDGFKTLNIVFRGGQEYRSCVLFFYPEYVVYATDSQYIQNEIKYFDRTTHEIRIIQQVQGSVIKGTQCGDRVMISTAVEPSEVNLGSESYVWTSDNGLEWQQIYEGTKDCLPSIFQFALFEFP
ncbi:MAG: hypothetical protein IKD24_04250, partial [Alistipes sp.]|nr:hypothetical protein [Alistipes sp.]